MTESSIPRKAEGMTWGKTALLIVVGLVGYHLVAHVWLVKWLTPTRDVAAAASAVTDSTVPPTSAATQRVMGDPKKCLTAKKNDTENNPGKRLNNYLSDKEVMVLDDGTQCYGFYKWMAEIHWRVYGLQAVPDSHGPPPPPDPWGTGSN